MSQITTDMFRLSSSRSGSYLIDITGFVARVTRRVPIVEQELLTVLEHLTSTQVLWGSFCSFFCFLCIVF